MNDGVGKFKEYGFRLRHPDDDVVELFHGDEKIATYAQLGVDAETLQMECREHMINVHRADAALLPEKS